MKQLFCLGHFQINHSLYWKGLQQVDKYAIVGVNVKLYMHLIFHFPPDCNIYNSLNDGYMLSIPTYLLSQT